MTFSAAFNGHRPGQAAADIRAAVSVSLRCSDKIDGPGAWSRCILRH
jgi:hypothetical protein